MDPELTRHSIERGRRRAARRDRKRRGPAVVMDNPGLRRLAMQIAERARLGARPPARTGSGRRRRR